MVGRTNTCDFALSENENCTCNLKDGCKSAHKTFAGLVAKSPFLTLHHTKSFAVEQTHHVDTFIPSLVQIGGSNRRKALMRWKYTSSEF